MNKNATRAAFKNFIIIAVLMLTAFRYHDQVPAQTAGGILNILPVRPDTTAVSVPPDSLELDPFYQKYLVASGIPVISSENVPDEALYAVRKMVNEMMALRKDVLKKMLANKIHISIMAKTEVTTDLPECRDWNKIFPEENWNTRGRGYGATASYPVSSCAEENILCYPAEEDGYYGEDIFIHEFAHSIHGLGIKFIDADIDEQLQAALDNAISKGLWKNTYAASNIDEYFAEGVQDWYNVNAEAVPANGIHNSVNTREELRQYDPALYSIIRKYFRAGNQKISCHQL